MTVDSADITEAPAHKTGRAAERRLHKFILDVCVDEVVLDYLLPDGKPHGYETVLWDYKRSLPDLSGRGDEEAVRTASVAIAELVKDVVAFHNSHGGYIVAGVDQFAEEPILGCSNLGGSGFTVDKLNEQLVSYTKSRIECRFARLPVHNGAGEERWIGLVVIPMRAPGSPVVRMVRGAPEVKNKASYAKNAIFARIGDACMPAREESQILRFLCSRRVFGADADEASRLLLHNLPAADPNLIRFVGRGDYLFQLWNWMIDRHTTVKTLTALGGTGKTAIAFEFCLQFLADPPTWAEKLVWLSAKQRAFSAVQGKYVEMTRTDFSSGTDFLAALASELGAMDGEVEAAGDDEAELLDLVYDGLKAFPSLVVVDDIDTLSIEDQNNLFSTIQLLAGRLHDTGCRFLFTSRLDLGGESQRIKVAGFEEKEFTEYAKMVAAERSVQLDGNLIQQLFRASKGSPIFCSSIIRLASFAIPMHQAIKSWKGKDGEAVRRFAFERELSELNESQGRTLFALCALGETTQLELKQVLEADEHTLNMDLAKLREFHMFASGGDPRTGAKLEVPEPILLMRDILAERVRDPKRLERECARLRSRSPKVSDRASIAIATVVALWKADDYEGALLSAKQAAKDSNKSGDVRCIIGQCHLKTRPPRPDEADKEFAEAQRLGCSRPELVPAWLEAKASLADWVGIVELVGKVPPREVRSQSAFLYVRALFELGSQAVSRNDRVKARERFKQAMTAASRSIGQGLAGDKLSEVRELCRWSAQNYVGVVDADSTRAGDRLDVFNAVADAFDCHVTETRLVLLGLDALSAWASEAIGRAKRDPEALRILARRLDRLSDMRQHIVSQDRLRAELVERMDAVQDRLESRLRTLAA